MATMDRDSERLSTSLEYISKIALAEEKHFDFDAKAPEKSGKGLVVKPKKRLAVGSGACTRTLCELEVRHVLLSALSRQKGITFSGYSKKMLNTEQECPASGKDHWAYLLEEMKWMSNDFKNEHKWKHQRQKKLVREAKRYVTNKKNKILREERARLAKSKQLAASIGRTVKKFWQKIERIVIFKQRQEALEKQKKSMDKHLEYLVEQTERYSNLLSKNLKNGVVDISAADRGAKKKKKRANKVLDNGSTMEDDSDLEYEAYDELDDETTMAEQERREDPGEVANELDALKREGEMDVEQLRAYYKGRHESKYEERSSNDSDESDMDFEEDRNEMDDETTLDEQEKNENKNDVENEISLLQEEGTMPIEKLRAMYAGHRGASSSSQALTSKETASDSDLDFEEDKFELDDETTMDEQEAKENRKDVDQEILLLQKESEMPIEKLRAMYAGRHERDLFSDSEEENSGFDGEAVTDNDDGVQGEPDSEKLPEKDGPSKNENKQNDTTGEPDEDDKDFSCDDEEVDDESTMVAAEIQENAREVQNEVNSLKREATMDIEELRALYYGGRGRKMDNIDDYDSSASVSDNDSDEDPDLDFREDDVPDDEATLEEQERSENKSEVAHEVSQLQRESTMSIEELKKMYGRGTKAQKAEESSLDGYDSSSDLDYADASNSLDDETTLAQQEREEDPIEVADEVSALKEEGEMSIEELRKMYAGFIKNGRSKRTSTLKDETMEDVTDDNDDDDDDDKMNENNSCTDVVAVAPMAKKAEIVIPYPFLLNNINGFKLRNYQLEGLSWLVSLFYNRLNGILADEMGLGKTIQTISLLAHIAGHVGIWGPHLIIVPTSTILNWEMEFKRWCPGFKVMTYYGSTKVRKEKRTGWTKPNAFHVCITSYQLAVQDASVFKRKKWYYMILDEAHNIKNFRSQRWQTLLNFNTKRRLMLTGTPLQNSLMELWSLMHFLMPHVFQSQKEFKYWFSNPLTSMVESNPGSKTTGNNAVVQRLHSIMRPFMLRRLKTEVAKQLPKKYEHIVDVDLSRRQSYLYEDFISRASTQSKLTSGNYMGMMSVLMKLRQVCNHPDIFEPRVILSPFVMEPLEVVVAARMLRTGKEPFNLVHGDNLACRELSSLTKSSANRVEELAAQGKQLIEVITNPATAADPLSPKLVLTRSALTAGNLNVEKSTQTIFANACENHRRLQETKKMERAVAVAEMNHKRCQSASLAPLYGCSLRKFLSVDTIPGDVLDSEVWKGVVPSLEKRVEKMLPAIERFVCNPPVCKAGKPRLVTPNRVVSTFKSNWETVQVKRVEQKLRSGLAVFHPASIRLTLAFPDRMLVQYDCGKLQVLAKLLRKLKSGGHRVLIFTQMTKMLNILEQFLNLHGHIYLRLDGSTKVEARQQMMDRFNSDKRVFVFILSTRSGGLGINLTGADTVIFYDSDWNPCMDAQAQDRAHRIGQTRDVHIYRLVTKHTVEENIMLKANQKRQLNKLSVEDGNFTMGSFFSSSGELQQIFGKGDVQASNETSTSSSSKKDVSQEEEARIMSMLEDSEDKDAAKRAQQEANDDLAEFDESRPLAVAKSTTPVASSSGKKSKSPAAQKQETVLSMQELSSLESSLRPVEKYALNFRSTSTLVVHKIAVQRLLREMAESRTDNWELQQLEENREAMEEEGSEEIIAALGAEDGGFSRACEHEQMYYSAKRTQKIRSKLDKLLGRFWVEQINPRSGRRHYFNTATRELSFEQPAALKVRSEEALCRSVGWGGMPQNILVRCFQMLEPYPSLRLASMVCKTFYFASRHWRLAIWVDSNLTKTRNDFLIVGTKVNARYKGGDEWFPGVIMRSRPSSTNNVEDNDNGEKVPGPSFDILYTDGVEEKNVPEAYVRVDNGERYTVITPSNKNDMPYEFLNKDLSCPPICSVAPPAPRRCGSLVEALRVSLPGDTVVLRCGNHDVSKGEETALVVNKKIKLVGEDAFARSHCDLKREARLYISGLQIPGEELKFKDETNEKANAYIADPTLRPSVLLKQALVYRGSSTGTFVLHGISLSRTTNVEPGLSSWSATTPVKRDSETSTCPPLAKINEETSEKVRSTRRSVKRVKTPKASEKDSASEVGSEKFCVAIEGGNMHIVNCDISNNGGHGACVVIEANGYLETSRSRIHSSPASGVMLGKGELLMVNCEVTKNKMCGVLLFDGRAVIKCCRIYGHKGAGIRVVGSRGVAAVVEGNDLRGNRGGAFDMKLDGVWTKMFECKNNLVKRGDSFKEDPQKCIKSNEVTRHTTALVQSNVLEGAVMSGSKKKTKSSSSKKSGAKRKKNKEKKLKSGKRKKLKVDTKM